MERKPLSSPLSGFLIYAIRHRGDAYKEERQKWGKHGVFKGRIYRDGDFTLFVESSLSEAMDIYKVAHKPVFCTETMQMISEKTIIDSVNVKLNLKFGKISVYQKMKRLLKRIIG